MDFFRSYFFKNERRMKSDSPVIKKLERHIFTLCECLSNVLITGESNFDEINAQLIRGLFLKK